MNARERILAAMAWEEPDQVPWTIYDALSIGGAAEREMRDMGLCMIRRCAAHQTEHCQVEFDQVEYEESGRRLSRHIIRTPVGEVSCVQAAGGWPMEHYIKRSEDYAVMEFVWRDAIHRDNYQAIREAQEALGDEGLVIVRVGKGPLLEILYGMMGLERFSIDLYERPELIDSLYDLMVQRYDEFYDLAAESPAEILQAADNIPADVVGLERYRRYCMPLYERHMRRLVGTGKRLVVHMDGLLRSLIGAIGESCFDVLEAFTPAPMGDVTVREARQAWSDKALWLNFPGSVHIQKDEAIADQTRQLIEEAGDKRGFAIGITEDIPPDHWARSMRVIGRTIREVG